MNFRLRDLSTSVRLGLTGLMAVMLMGLAASAAHLFWHYEKRDEQAGFSIDDVRSAYRGINSPSRLHESLMSGHPEELPKDARQTLIKWLEGSKVSEDYDSLDLGAAAPAELIAKHCASCHSRKADKADPRARALPLEFWDDVKKVAFARKIEPVPDKIKAMSTHAHALSLATLSLVVSFMACATRLPRGLIGILVGLTGLALMADIGSWWLAKQADVFVYVIVGAGGVYNGGTALLVVLITLDMWLPKGRARA